MEESNAREGIDILFVQSNPSQVDQPFYELLHRATGRIGVALLNSRSPDRRSVDPELGLVPVFPEFCSTVPTGLFGSEKEGGVGELLRAIALRKPKLVVVQDQSWPAKLRIAFACRRRGISVAMRSDKNGTSTYARRGVKRRLEGVLVRMMFNLLAPVSRLSSDYYGWSDLQTCWWFPYPTLGSKFAMNDERREIGAEARRGMGIGTDAMVFLVVAKFVPRENPATAIMAFARLKCAGAALIVIGAGSMDSDLRELASTLGVRERTHFVGYVPYADLQRYFWASDVFVHLPLSEPWGISVQDALIAGMGVIASNKVGAALCHLDGTLGKYVIDADDIEAAACLMSELCEARGAVAVFARARERVLTGFTVEALASAWAARIEAL